MGYEDKVAVDPHSMGLALQANDVASLSLIRFKERVSLTLTQQRNVMPIDPKVSTILHIFLPTYIFTKFKCYQNFLPAGLKCIDQR